MVAILTLLSASFPVLLGLQLAAANPETVTSSLRQLFTRQSSTNPIDPSDIPSQCQNQCNPLVSALQGCTDIKCVCNDKNSGLIATCFDCALTVPNVGVTQAQAQAAFDQYASSCKAGGITVKSQTIKAGNGAPGRSVGVAGLLGVTLGAMVVLA